MFVFVSSSCFSGCMSSLVRKKKQQKRTKAVAKAFAKAKGKGRGGGRGQRRGRGQGHGKGKGKPRNAQVPAQVQDSEVEESELADEEMQLPDGSLPPELANVLAPEPASASVLAPAVREESQSADPASVLALVDPEDPQPARPAEPASVLAPVLAPAVPEDPQPAIPASVLAAVDSQEPAEPVVPAAVVPASLAPSEAAGSTGVPRHVSPKEFSTPAVVQNLAPPNCTFVLDHKAHRFSFRFKKVPNPNVWKGVYRYPMTMSKAFTKESRESWTKALAEIHTNAWERWGLCREQKGWKISDAALVQDAGVIPNNILSEIQEEIDAMPPPVKYSKKS